MPQGKNGKAGRGYDHALDLRGKTCPELLLDIKRAIKKKPLGYKINIITNDKLALIDVPHFLQRTSQVLLYTYNEGKNHCFVVQVKTKR